MLVRLHTGAGPAEADAQLGRIREELIATLVASARSGNKTGAIRSYVDIPKCSLMDAKREIGHLLEE